MFLQIWRFTTALVSHCSESISGQMRQPERPN